jgi:hypothetical protein
MNWLLIENKGLLEMESLYLMGASTKRNNESMIGMFGSGNKYAIALLLRHNIPFKIFSGSMEIDITTRKVELRGTEFDIIQVNGKDTSLTIQMGPQWEPWYAIREIYSNALDEGEARIFVTEDINYSADHTRFYIGVTEEVEDIIDNKWNTYFTMERDDLLFELKERSPLKVYPNLDISRRLLVYRKGILVSNAEVSSFYSYDMPTADIDESRSLRDMYPLREAVVKSWMLCPDAGLIEQFLLNIDTAIRADRELAYFELDLNWSWYDHLLSPDVWNPAIGDRIIINQRMTGMFKEEQNLNSLILPHSLCIAIAKRLPDVPVYGVSEGNAINYVQMELNKKMHFKLERALEDLKELEFEITHPIKVVKFHSTSTLGMAQQGQILISHQVVDGGSIRDISVVLIEEELHINKGFEDCSRNMQDYLFQQWINERETRLGRYLL